MNYEEKIINLKNFLREQAKRNEDAAETTKYSHARDLNYGYAAAYTLCAEWLNEILEGNALQSKWAERRNIWKIWQVSTRTLCKLSRS